MTARTIAQPAVHHQRNGFRLSATITRSEATISAER